MCPALVVTRALVRAGRAGLASKTCGRAASSPRPAPPSWRLDLGGEAALVEEIARLHGFDAIPAEPLPPLRAVPLPALNLGQRRIRVARRALAARGLVEAVTYSFIKRSEAELFGGGQEQLLLLNPISADMDAMRPSILP